jgi:hypothetical protein
MQITIKIDALTVKGKIDEQGTFHKNLIAKVTIAFDPDVEAFLSGHLMEVLVADVDPKQFEFEK